MKKYNDYKDSNIPLARKIPYHWNEIKLKNLAANKSDSFVDGPFGSDLKTEHYTDFGIPIIQLNNLKDGEHINKNTKYTSEKKANSMRRSNIFPGDIVITKMMPVARAAIVNNEYERYLISSDCIKFLVDEEKIDKRFLIYSINCNYFRSNAESHSTGSTRLRTNLSLVKNFKVLYPTLKEQVAIANFLDEKSVQIQTLIEHKKIILETLHKYRQSHISETVKRGLNPQVKMKDSGVDCIGMIPEHWEISKIKYQFKNLDYKRIPLSAEERGKMIEKKYDYYGASGVIDKVDDYIFDDTLILVGEDGANLLSRNTPLAFVASGKFWVNNHAHILKPINGNINYLVNMLESLDYKNFVTGSAQPKLTADNLKNMVIIVPPMNEQNSISKFIESKTTELNKLIYEIKAQIETLSNYRQSLIFEAVTGKIDVRDYKDSELEVKM